MDPCDTFFYIGKQILFSLWQWTTERKETQRELKYFLNYGALCGCRSGHVSRELSLWLHRCGSREQH